MLVSALAIYLAVVALTRVVGPRSLASVSTFDLAVTVAMGAIVGRVVLVRTSLAAGVVGLATLLLTQAVLARARNRTRWGRRIDRSPVLLLRDGEVLEENLRRSGLSREDVYEQVRLSGGGPLDEVRAVVLERSGRFSVVRHGAFDDRLFEDVSGWSGPER